MIDTDERALMEETVRGALADAIADGEDIEAALAKLGPCPAHRKSYSPIAKLLAEADRAAQPQEAWAWDDE